MRGGVILIVIALVIGYLGVTGRYCCFGMFLSCMYNPEGYCTAGGGAKGAVGTGGGAAPIVIAPGSVGVNESGGQVYDGRDRFAGFLPPIEAFI